MRRNIQYPKKKPKRDSARALDIHIENSKKIVAIKKKKDALHTLLKP